jgi:hypothetical protein
MIWTESDLEDELVSGCLECRLNEVLLCETATSRNGRVKSRKDIVKKLRNRDEKRGKRVWENETVGWRL